MIESNVDISDIKNIITDRSFPWYFIHSSSNAEQNSNFSGLQYGFYHLVFLDDQWTSNIFNNFNNVLDQVSNISKINKLLRIRIGMQTNVGRESINYPHTDYDFNHKTALIYINESDGDTIFYKKTLFNNEDYDIYKKISPDPGKMVIFDGIRYHSSSHPIKYDRRIALNINFI